MCEGRRFAQWWVQENPSPPETAEARKRFELQRKAWVAAMDLAESQAFLRAIDGRSFTWTQSPNGRSWFYESSDLCACVWFDCGVCWWDVSGPEGRGTKVSGGIRETPSDVETVVSIAKGRAELWIAGYRRGRDGSPWGVMDVVDGDQLSAGDLVCEADEWPTRENVCLVVQGDHEGAAVYVASGSLTSLNPDRRYRRVYKGPLRG